MTGPGAENSCTFHMHTAPKASATTATNGIQTRAKTVLPTERGLTRSPPGIPFQNSRSRSVPDFRPRAVTPGPYINYVDIRKVEGLPPWVKMRTPGVRTLSPAGAVGSMGEPVFNWPGIDDC
jgi:hypothetical protein